jgi:hypothetical protein
MALHMRKTNRLRFQEAAQFAATLLGFPCRAAALHRWRMVGIKGQFLDSVKIGGLRFTTEGAIRRFIEGVTTACEAELDRI